MTFIGQRSTNLDTIALNNTVNVSTSAIFDSALVDGTEYVITAPITISSINIPTGATVVIRAENASTNIVSTALTGSNALFNGDLTRLQLSDIQFSNATINGRFFNINATTAARPVVTTARVIATNYADPGTVAGAVFIPQNLVFVNSTGPLTLHNNGDSFGDGILGDEINFINHSGDRMVVTGTSDFVLLDRVVVGTVGSGDQAFDISGLTATGRVAITNTSMDPGSAGDLGLTRAISSATTLDSRFREIETNSSGGAFTITLPDTTSFVFEAGDRLFFRTDSNASTNNVTIAVNSNDSSTIDAGSSYVMDMNDYGYIVEYLGGARWTVVNRLSGDIDTPPVFTSFTVSINQNVADGTTLSGTQTFTWTVTNTNNISGNLTIADDGGNLSTSIVPTSSPQDLTITTQTLNAGETATFTISGTDTNANPFSRNYVVTAAAESEFLYWDLSDSNNPASIVVANMESAAITGSGQTIPASIGPTTLNDYIIILAPSDNDLSQIINTALNVNVISTYTKTTNVRQIGGQNYNSYVFGPVNAGFTVNYNFVIA